MQYPIYTVDAFAEKLFSGNPAAVCPLETWLPDATMQSLAVENNLSETVFFVPENGDYHIRWFTPGTEVKLCGHATLASAHILFTELGYEKEEIIFHSKSGPLKVSRLEGAKIKLDFPSNPPEAVTDIPSGLFEGLGISSAPVYKTSFDYMVVLENQAAIEKLTPNFTALASVEARGVIATAIGNEVDFVSRCFYPQSGINEDPVTGSAHTILTPYWSQRLNKLQMQAKQLSRRGGKLELELANDRVYMIGKGITYMQGKYSI